ncbi:MAG: metal ABC transporter permease [Deltaproteobacteria bacterium]|nr:metal ABC transporter permease [Deltaproteobacteria bacterium]
MWDTVAFMLKPFLACLVIPGIHAYLGIHVISREEIFVDIALAQLAALGATVAFLFGHDLQGAMASLYALGFSFVGAAVFSVTRSREGRVPQEAVIGIVYAISAAAAILVIDRAPQGAEHIKSMLVGSILTVSWPEILSAAGLYLVLGGFHWAFRRPFLQISFSPGEAQARGLHIRLWDFLFYASFGVVVTVSVRMAGVLLVFSYLVVWAGR